MGSCTNHSTFLGFVSLNWKPLSSSYVRLTGKELLVVGVHVEPEKIPITFSNLSNYLALPRLHDWAVPLGSDLLDGITETGRFRWAPCGGTAPNQAHLPSWACPRNVRVGVIRPLEGRVGAGSGQRREPRRGRQASEAAPLPPQGTSLSTGDAGSSLSLCLPDTDWILLRL